MKIPGFYKKFCFWLLCANNYRSPRPWWSRFATVFTYTGRDWRERFGWSVWLHWHLHGIINPLIHWLPMWKGVKELNSRLSRVWINEVYPILSDKAEPR